MILSYFYMKYFRYFMPLDAVIESEMRDCSIIKQLTLNPEDYRIPKYASDPIVGSFIYQKKPQ